MSAGDLALVAGCGIIGIVMVSRVMQKLPEKKISNWRRYGLMTCVFLLIAGKFIKGTKSYMVAWLTASR